MSYNNAYTPYIVMPSYNLGGNNCRTLSNINKNPTMAYTHHPPPTFIVNFIFYYTRRKKNLKKTKNGKNYKLL